MNKPNAKTVSLRTQGLASSASFNNRKPIHPHMANEKKTKANELINELKKKANELKWGEQQQQQQWSKGKNMAFISHNS